MTAKADCQFHLFTGEAATGSGRVGLLQIFDANVPQAFAPNERADFEAFLDSRPQNYWCVLYGGSLVGAFGVTVLGSGHASLNWILLSPKHHGLGLGMRMINHARLVAQKAGCHVMTIAASHVSAPYFERFGAHAQIRTRNGWGPGMDRVDMVMTLV